MKINLASKITLARILLSIVLIILMILKVNTIVLGVIFAIAALTDKLDGYIARSRNEVTDFGKVTDAIADKILVTPILFLMAISGMIFSSVEISLIIPLVFFLRDEIVNNVKTIASSKGPVVSASSLGKAKTAFMMVGMAILMFSFPSYLSSFGEILNLIGQIFVILGTILSIVSGIDYWLKNKKYIFN